MRQFLVATFAAATLTYARPSTIAAQNPPAARVTAVTFTSKPATARQPATLAPAFQRRPGLRSADSMDRLKAAG